MEAAVKMINPSTNIDDCQRNWTKIALCLRGRKFATCVVNDDNGIHLVKLPVADYDRYARPRAETPKKVAQQLLAFTRRDVSPKSITQGAFDILNDVVSGQIPEEDVEYVPPPAAASNGEKPATRSTILAAICQELKIEAAVARRKLRKAGLHAPYEDEKAIRKALAH